MSHIDAPIRIHFNEQIGTQLPRHTVKLKFFPLLGAFAVGGTGHSSSPLPCVVFPRGWNFKHWQIGHSLHHDK
jgi:hypothetical protein